MIRQIIRIDEEKCNGCGLCAQACHESAIAMVDGKARLIRDDYCDGMGDCLPQCPTGAISFEEREAAAYDKEAVEANMKKKKLEEKNAAQVEQEAVRLMGGCPGAASRQIRRTAEAAAPQNGSGISGMAPQPRRTVPGISGMAPQPRRTVPGRFGLALRLHRKPRYLNWRTGRFRSSLPRFRPRTLTERSF